METKVWLKEPQTTEKKLIEIDPELGRVATALRLVPYFRLWSIAQQLNRQGDGSGKLAKSAFFQALREFGVTHTKSHFNNIIRRGLGTFWRIDENHKNIYLVGYYKLAETFTQKALDSNYQIIATNGIGRKFVYVPAEETLHTFEARLFHAWFHHRDDRKLNGIANETLCKLFNRSLPTIQSWKKHAGISPIPRYAQYGGDNEELVPDYSMIYYTKKGELRYSWRLPNAYSVPVLKEKNHKHVPNVTRHKLNHFTDEYISASLRTDGLRIADAEFCIGGAPLWTGKLFFNGDDDVKAHKRVMRHLKRYRDYSVAHYSYLGQRYGVWVYDCFDDDYSMTELYERDFRKEETKEFSYRLAWYLEMRQYQKWATS